MATKKNAPVKSGKATVKSVTVSGGKASKPVKAAPKKAAPKVLPKKAAAPQKVAPKKVAPKPAPKKAVKPAPKPVKKAVKPAPKKVVVAKKTAKPVVKQVVPVKKNPIKPAAKTIVKPAKPVVKAPVKAAVKTIIKPMAKKEEIKKPVVEKAVAAKPPAPVKAKDIKVPAPKPVVIPKISTKTVRKYQPDFTKSVLDKTPVDPGAPSQRYSDAELEEFRELIQRKLEAAKKELAYLHGLITRKDEMGGDEGDNRYMTMEDGSLSMEREQLSQMASRQITFIDHLEKAIMRIENKTYGICRVTGKLIDKARLRAVPHATLSIEAKMSSSR